MAKSEQYTNLVYYRAPREAEWVQIGKVMTTGVVPLFKSTLRDLVAAQISIDAKRIKITDAEKDMVNVEIDGRFSGTLRWDARRGVV